MEYLLEKTAPYPQIYQMLRELFSTSSNQQVGLILSQRLINMPVQVAPHMYRLLADEIKRAVDEVSGQQSIKNESLIKGGRMNHTISRIISAFRGHIHCLLTRSNHWTLLHRRPKN
jgi:hypothetical protein